MGHGRERQAGINAPYVEDTSIDRVHVTLFTRRDTVSVLSFLRSAELVRKRLQLTFESTNH